jgi:hypothetical protein
MTITLNPDQFDKKCVIFSDTKKNIIMDGNFTKIIYSDENVSLNGIFINFPVNIYSNNKTSNKNFFYFQPHSNENKSLIYNIIQIEQDIINHYKNMYNINKKCIFSISQQILSGILKIYCEELNMNCTNFVIKISGVWEDKTQFGLTYKFMQTANIYNFNDEIELTSS